MKHGVQGGSAHLDLSRLLRETIDAIRECLGLEPLYRVVKREPGQILIQREWGLYAEGCRRVMPIRYGTHGQTLALEFRRKLVRGRRYR